MPTYRFSLWFCPKRIYDPDNIPQHEILLFFSPASNQEMQGDIKEYESQRDDYACNPRKKKVTQGSVFRLKSDVNSDFTWFPPLAHWLITSTYYTWSGTIARNRCCLLSGFEFWSKIVVTFWGFVTDLTHPLLILSFCNIHSRETKEHQGFLDPREIVEQRFAILCIELP